MERDSFESVEIAFHLHPGTAQALLHNEGVYFKTFTGKTNVRRVNIVIKAAQKADIANYLLSMSYDFATNFTTALLIGFGVTTHSEFYDLLESSADDITLVSKDARQPVQIKAMIDSAALFWDHPTILPTLILQNHAARSDAFSTFLGGNVLNVEHSVGVAFPYRKVGMDSATFTARTREELYEFTARIHANMVQIMFVMHVYDWASGCCEFILNLHDEILAQLHRSSPRLEPLSAELRDTIEHTSASTKCLKHFMATLKDRAQSQLDVVSTTNVPTLHHIFSY